MGEFWAEGDFLVVPLLVILVMSVKSNEDMGFESLTSLELLMYWN